MVTARFFPEGLERALLWLVTGYRVFGAAWMVLLGTLVLASSDNAEHPGWVIAALSVVVVWTLLSVAFALQTPTATATWTFVFLDIGVGVFAVAASVLADSILFAGGYPLAGVFAAIYAKGTVGGAVAATALTVASLARLPGRPSFDQPSEVSIVISYLFSAAAAAGAASVLRNSDRRRAAAEEALAIEQSARARADERSEMAAHLHDSVLQTLALIQRDGTATDRVRGLARRQERELRGWLYQHDAGIRAGFRDAVTAMTAEIDDMTDTHIERIQVGDAPMNEHLDALVRAGREALLNAAKHAGPGQITVYAEITGDEAALFVKDRGTGFDPASVPADRRGIADSILGRMKRHGGSAEITSQPGTGTEVRLLMPIGEADD
jgi:signal transduction histidine kinase